MSVTTNDPDPSPDEPATATGREADRPRPTRRLLLAAGLVAGLAAFGIGEATHDIIAPKLVLQNTMGHEMMVANSATQMEANVRNASLAFGILGACLGACLGIAGGLARRSARAAMAAGLLGSIATAAVAASASAATLAQFIYARLTYSEYEMVLSIAMHGLILGLSGAGAGLSFAIGLGVPRRGLLLAAAAGVFGAVAGSVAFDLLGAVAFPLAETGEPISTTWASRLLARMLVAIGTGAALALSMPRPGPAPTGPAANP